MTLGVACLQGLRKFADDKAFQQKWQAVKQTAKERAVARIRELTGVDIRSDALMDVQVIISPTTVAVRYHQPFLLNFNSYPCIYDCNILLFLGTI